MSKYWQMFSSRLCFYGGIFTITLSEMKLFWTCQTLNFQRVDLCMWFPLEHFLLKACKIGCKCGQLVAFWKFSGSSFHAFFQRTPNPLVSTDVYDFSPSILLENDFTFSNVVIRILYIATLACQAGLLLIDMDFLLTLSELFSLNFILLCGNQMIHTSLYFAVFGEIWC